MKIRLAEKRDIECLLEIYNYFKQLASISEEC